MNVPKLRFKDDDGQNFPNWKNSTLGKIAEIKRGAASQHLRYVEDKINGIRLIRINDFLKNEPVYVEVTQDIMRFTLQRNDLLIAGTGATAGIVFRVPNEFEDLAYSYNAPRIRVNQANDGFIYYYLISDVVLKQQQGLFVGNAQPFLDTDAIRGFQIGLPSLPEQTKIANFLTAIDKKISQLTQKYDLLMQYKKGIMQQIFSQKLRFKDEDGREFPEWEERELGDVTEIIMGQSPDSNSYNELAEGKPLIQGNADISNRKTNPRVWTTAPTKECKFNDIILTVRAPVGAVAISYHQACIGRGVCAIRSKKETLSSYVYQLLLWFEPTKWVSLEQGSTFTAVSSKDIKTIDIPFPSLPEQTKIANFLTAIDNKITHTKTQLDAVKLYKKGLLQQLFV